jgi:hypothetical protein
MVAQVKIKQTQTHNTHKSRHHNLQENATPTQELDRLPTRMPNKRHVGDEARGQTYETMSCVVCRWPSACATKRRRGRRPNAEPQTTNVGADAERRSPTSPRGGEAVMRAQTNWARRRYAQTCMSLHQPKTATIAYNAIAPMKTELCSLLTEVRQRSEVQAQSQTRRSPRRARSMNCARKAMLHAHIKARPRGWQRYCCRLYSHRVTSIVIPWADSRQERIAQEP